MKIWWRWIKLYLTCGLGHHAPVENTWFPGGVLYSQCSRCHCAKYRKPGMQRPIHLNPSYWDVARGLYDRNLE